MHDALKRTLEVEVAELREARKIATELKEKLKEQEELLNRIRIKRKSEMEQSLFERNASYDKELALLELTLQCNSRRCAGT